MTQTTPVQPKMRRRRLLRPVGGAPPAEASAALEALHAEIVLLREENARLKAAQHELPGLGSLMRQVNELTDMVPGESVSDEAAQLLAETLVLRESLLEACRDIRKSLKAVQERLRDPRPTP